jgi:23S rRNA (uracil1939-C5)-methyltransferase
MTVSGRGKSRPEFFMDIDVTLTTLTYGGDAMGRFSGPQTGMESRVVFVPLSLPGEKVRARVIEEKRGFIRAELMEVLTPSPHRIAPRCNHFGACGGCHYQHMPYAKQLQAKEAILGDQFERIARIKDPPIKPIVPSPNQWNYRNHVQFHLTSDGNLGFVSLAGTHFPREWGRRNKNIIPISECHILEEPIALQWPQLTFDADITLERVSLRAGTDETLMLVLESDDPQLPALDIEADISVIHLTKGDIVVMAGYPYLDIDVLGKSFRVSAASFFQVNSPMASKMVEHLLARLPLSTQITLLDIYCGVGLFSAFLAPRVRRLIGIESSPSACDDFTVNLAEFNNVDLYEATAEETLPAISAHPDVIVVDPPRAGLDKRVLDAILVLKPDTLAYVSCDPATLARDAARLITGGYRLLETTPFDLFPQTYHIESISIFKIK